MVDMPTLFRPFYKDISDLLSKPLHSDLSDDSDYEKITLHGIKMHTKVILCYF